MEKNKKIHVDISNAREKAQIEVMQKITSAGECPFCEENLRKYHKKKIKSSTYWLVTRNQWPYKKTKLQILFIVKRHVTSIAELKAEEWYELGLLVKREVKKYKVPGGAFAMRFGQTKYSAATVQHLHAQIIVPDVKKLKENESVVFFIGKPLKKK